jgi:PAT family beta-lactamase induction signal transducer AmpG
MILAMHLPILGFVALAHFHPSSVYYLCDCYWRAIGYGFFAFMMYLIYVADGESKPTLLYCYWIYGIRNDASGMASGFIQEYLGYGNFYLGVSSHYSWINSVKILDFPVRLWKEI